MKRRHSLLKGPGVVLLLAALLVLALALAWQFTDLSEFTEPARVREILAESAGEPWAFAFVLTAFLLGSATAFPVTILIFATAAVFGPAFGMLYTALCVTICGLITYWIGRRFGQEVLGRLLGRLFGDRWRRARLLLQQRGVLAVVAIRIVPVAPFTLINLAAGATGIRPVDFALGTLLGMGPGIVAITLLGDRLVRVVQNPDSEEIMLFGFCVVGWLALSFAAQAFVSRWSRRATQA